ncbi:MAG: IS110 family transposase [Planctomycetes bacterium]|nr:IS110 family transposase [Planctomycetota bacterium]
MINPRREKFEKIKQSIKEAQNYLLIGIDISKDKHDACVMISSGRMLNRRLQFENSKAGYEMFIEKIKEYQQAIKPDETIIGLETTGNYMIALADYLSLKGYFVVQVSSFITKRNRDTLDLSWNKNDIKDAWNVVDCMKQGKMIYYDDDNPPYGDIRRLMTLYSRLSKERGLYRVRLQNNILCMTFPEFTKAYPVVSELVPLTILERYPLPQDIVKVQEKEFIDDIKKHADPTLKRSKIIELYRLAQESIGSTLDQESLRWETQFIVREIQRIRREQKLLLEKVQFLCKQCPQYDLLQTIPGIGPVIGAGMVAEIGDIQNYRSSRQILKLAGLDLSRIESGKFQGETHVSKRGRPLLRSLAFQAGLVAVRNDTRLRLKYLDLIERNKVKRGSKRKFIIAVSCKILRIVYAVMKSMKPYDSDFDQTKEQPNRLGSVIMAV